MIILELKASYYCNMNCAFCIFSGRKGQHKPLTKREITKAVGQINKHYSSIDYFVISGGEPTIRKDFWDILTIVNNSLKPKKIILHTNGLKLPSGKDLNKLGLKKVVIFLSFHTCSPETHFQFTNSRSFDLLNKNLENFSRMGLNVFTNTLIMKPNQYEIEKVSDYLFQKGVGGMEFRFPFGTGSRRKIYSWIIPDDFEAIARQLFSVIKKYSHKIDIFLHPSVPCLIRQMEDKWPYCKQKERKKLINHLFEQSETTVKKDEFLQLKKVQYLFLDPRMKIIKEKLQQQAINQGEKVFERIKNCQKCKFKNCCLGLPIEYSNVE